MSLGEILFSRRESMREGKEEEAGGENFLERTHRPGRKRRGKFCWEEKVLPFF